ncbi:MAG: TIGR03668 family PPOX class F420-dependent oxidoreductase [Thermoproteota archaeon]|nr:TIGR03668 family PPOX class F420-dependent oxidoreductase [Thermoproteota archaeon]
MNISPAFEEFIQRARVARLATVDSEFKPHIVPVVFVFDGNNFFIPVDEKRKAAKPGKLKRIRNIQDNPNVALLIDEYSEDWTKLAFIMIEGKASVATKEEQNIQVREAYKKLMAKYIQYQKVGVGEMCIIITPKKVASWSNS